MATILKYCNFVTHLQTKTKKVEFVFDQKKSALNFFFLNWLKIVALGENCIIEFI